MPSPRPQVNVMFNGDNIVPEANRSFSVSYVPGLTISQALASTGAIRFNDSGQIAGFYDIPIGGDIDCELALNSRSIPSTLLSFPIQPDDFVSLTLVYNPAPRIASVQDEDDDIDLS